jgi:hypothetical protein
MVRSRSVSSSTRGSHARISRARDIGQRCTGSSTDSGLRSMVERAMIFSPSSPAVASTGKNKERLGDSLPSG